MPVPDTDLLDNLNLISYLSELPSPPLSFICNEGQGGEEERKHWTKNGGHKLVTRGSNFTHRLFFFLADRVF